MLNTKELFLEGEENQIYWRLYSKKEHLMVTITAHRSEQPIFHWGVAREKWADWSAPNPAIWPPKTRNCHDGLAVQTLMSPEANNRFCLTITIPLNLHLRQIYFVLYFPHSRQWDNNHQQDYLIPLPDSSSCSLLDSQIRSLLGQILARENKKSWEMGMRLEFIQQLLSNLQPPNKAALKALDIYLQYATLYLPWRRYYDRQSYVLAPKISGFALKLSEMVSLYPQFLSLWRRMIKNLPSSGRNLYDIGMAIRLKILECKDHQNRIIYDQFVSEFHQKLHNASGPEDIFIARSYLAFLDSGGNLDQFYEILWQAGLAEKKIKDGHEIITPILDQYGDYRSIHHLPSYDAPKAAATRKVMQELLTLLENFFGGMEIKEAIELVRPYADSTLLENLQDLLNQKEALEAKFSPVAALELFEQLSRLRHQLHPRLFSSLREQTRDFLYLDLILEDYAKALANTLLKALPVAAAEPNRADCFSLLQALFQHLSSDDLPEISRVGQQVKAWKNRQDRGDIDWCLQGKAIFDHLHRLIQNQASSQMALPMVETLGRLLEIEPQKRQTLAEENVRGDWLFVLSRLVTLGQKTLRHIAGWSATDALVSGRVQGVVSAAKNFSSLPSLGSPLIVLLDQLPADEDIPAPVVGIISRVTQDRMSHFGIRAREQGVVWVYLDDEEDYEGLKKHEGKWIELSADEDQFSYTLIKEPSLSASPMNSLSEKKIIHFPTARLTDSVIFLTPDQYELSTVGPKAYNLRLLQERLPGLVSVPDSISVPFGVFELVLQQNQAISKEYHQILAGLSEESEDLSLRLKDLRTLVESLPALPGLQEAVQTRLGQSALIIRSSSNAEDLEGYSGAGLYESYAGVPVGFVKKVWAGKWIERAVRNRFKIGVSHEDVHLAVLIQKLILADYAFVVHTRYPLTQTSLKQEQLYLELVQGLGESLGSEGQGYSFVYDRVLREVKRVGYANKEYRWIVGAKGLVVREAADYSQDFLALSLENWESIIRRIFEISLLIEAAWANQPQDIEGVIKGEEIFIVQTRPQICHNSLTNGEFKK